MKGEKGHFNKNAQQDQNKGDLHCRRIEQAMSLNDFPYTHHIKRASF